MSRHDAATADFDRPNAARAHDWLLGGTLNTPLDRAAATAALQAHPALRDLLRDNRAFLRQAVHHMLDTGIRQFLDLGCGLPTMGAIHQLVSSRDLDARIVYVDHDPATAARITLLTRDRPHTAVVQADLRRPRAVLEHPDTAQLLHPDTPTGLIAVDILDTLPDQDQPDRIIGTYLRALAPGSHLALTHLTTWPTTRTDPIDSDVAVTPTTMPSFDTQRWWIRHPRHPTRVRGWLDMAELPSPTPSLRTRYTGKTEAITPTEVEVLRTLLVKN
ncbi:SAM-dependent methyltransferase [Saccharothrix syringae]|uniref:SAM-dependent methyltransferase n=1 Tax=Saccharothrix syringae TaxID=103733 RepID=UPI0006908A23|nr:SAM-dependent methyltransferase [Saccharothrix syringae]